MEPKSRISEAELTVMKIIWKADGPISTGEICRQLSEQAGWDRSTVRTLLKRLVEKNAVEEKKLGVLCYLPAVSEKEYRRAQTGRFLKRMYGGSAKRLVAFLVQDDQISEKELEELRDFLNKGAGVNE